MEYDLNKYLQVITFALHENIFYLLDLAQENGCVHYKLFPISGISNVPMDQIDAFCKKEMVDEEFGGLANWDGKSNYDICAIFLKYQYTRMANQLII